MPSRVARAVTNVMKAFSSWLCGSVMRSRSKHPCCAAMSWLPWLQHARRPFMFVSRETGSASERVGDAQLSLRWGACFTRRLLTPTADADSRRRPKTQESAVGIMTAVGRAQSLLAIQPLHAEDCQFNPGWMYVLGGPPAQRSRLACLCHSGPPFQKRTRPCRAPAPSSEEAPRLWRDPTSCGAGDQRHISRTMWQWTSQVDVVALGVVGTSF